MAYTLKQRLVPDGMGNNPNSRLPHITYITIANAKMHADYQ
jgi:hypothetical protein